LYFLSFFWHYGELRKKKSCPTFQTWTFLQKNLFPIIISECETKQKHLFYITDQTRSNIGADTF